MIETNKDGIGLHVMHNVFIILLFIFTTHTQTTNNTGEALKCKGHLVRTYNWFLLITTILMTDNDVLLMMMLRNDGDHIDDNDNPSDTLAVESDWLHYLTNSVDTHTDTIFSITPLFSCCTHLCHHLIDYTEFNGDTAPKILAFIEELKVVRRAELKLPCEATGK